MCAMRLKRLKIADLGIQKWQNLGLVPILWEPFSGSKSLNFSVLDMYSKMFKILLTILRNYQNLEPSNFKGHRI